MMAKLEQRHIDYLKIPKFYNLYLKYLTDRLVYSNNRLDKDSETKDIANKETLEDTYKALCLILSDKNEHLTEELIKKVNNAINEHSIYISEEYRKFDGMSNFSIELAENIPTKMKELINNYNEKWKSLEIFEKETLFNIEYLRIHPYEDGNGRTSRILLINSLLKHGHAPALIPEEIRKEYFTARNSNNVEWIKKLLIEESKQELIILDQLIEEYEKTPKKK